MRIIFQIISLLFFSLNVFSGSRSDSLNIKLAQTNSDTEKINILNDLSLLYIDTLPDLTIKYCNQAIALKREDHKGIMRTYLNLSQAHFNKAEYKKAIDYGVKYLDLANKFKDDKQIGFANITIANVYLYTEDFISARKFYNSAISIFEKSAFKRGLAIAYNNTAITYDYEMKLDSSLYYYFKALHIYTRENDKEQIALSYTNIGDTYRIKKDYKKAAYFQKKAVEVQRETGDYNTLIVTLSGIGISYQEQKLYHEALKYYKEAEALAIKMNKRKELMDIDEKFYQTYKSLGNNALAMEYLEKKIALKDTLMDENLKKANTEFNVKFESQQKANEIKLLSADKKLKESQLQEGKTVRKYLMISVILFIFIAIALSFAFNTKRNANQRLEKLNNELVIKQRQIAAKNEELNQQNEEIMAQRDEIDRQKHLVEEKNKEIVDSIHYAQRIQQSRITSETYINNYISSENYFILYHPKDIVSGDYYWALKHNDLFYFITADCTGHGVPGAFMSLLTISFLDEVILERKKTMPHEILNEMRSEIIKALNPDGKSQYKDGMDCVLMAIDFSKNKLYFSAANNPLWVLKKDGKEIIEYKPDKMPVGLSEGETKSFTMHSIDLQAGDIIYSFTDGYADQFGGPKGKKFKYNQLKDLLIKNSDQAMPDQKVALEQALNDWKYNYDQTDDILITGIKI